MLSSLGLLKEDSIDVPLLLGIALVLLLVLSAAVFADDDMVEARIQYIGGKPESLAVIYPEKLSAAKQSRDISYLKSTILSLDVVVTSGSVRRNGTECTTLCFLIHKSPFRPGSGSLLDITVSMLKRYRHINVECYGLPQPPGSSVSFRNRYVTVRGDYYGDLLEYDVIIKDNRFDRISLPDIYKSEKRSTAGIALLLAGITGAFYLFAVSKKR